MILDDILGDLETEGFVDVGWSNYPNSIVVESYYGNSLSEDDLDLIYEVASSWDSVIVERVDRERAEVILPHMRLR